MLYANSTQTELSWWELRTVVLPWFLCAPQCCVPRCFPVYSVHACFCISHLVTVSCFILISFSCVPHLFRLTSLSCACVVWASPCPCCCVFSLLCFPWVFLNVFQFGFWTLCCWSPALFPCSLPLHKPPHRQPPAWLPNGFCFSCWLPALFHLLPSLQRVSASSIIAGSLLGLLKSSTEGPSPLMPPTS